MALPKLKVSGRTLKRVIVTLVSLGILSVILVVTSSAGLLVGAGATGEELPVAPRTISFGVDATGLLRATAVQNFGGPVAFGNYWQFQLVSMVPDGKNVKKDEVLMTFDTQRIREDLQRFQNELDQATKELEKTRVQIDLEQEELKARLAAAENKLETFKLKQATGTDLQATKQVAQDKLGLEQARQELTSLKERLDWHKQSSEATYNIIASKKARAENKVNELKAGMEGFQVKADRDGVVVYKLKWNGERVQVGENVWSGWPVMEIPDLNTILVEAFVPEVDIGKIKLGQRVEVTIDAFPGKTYTGQVKSIGTLVRPKAWDIPNKVLDVQVTLDQLDVSIMRPAMSVKAKIETATMADVIAVPLKAVRTTAEGTLVKLKGETGWQEQKVELGESNGTDVIITRGLKPGERIAVDFAKAR